HPTLFRSNGRERRRGPGPADLRPASVPHRHAFAAGIGTALEEHTIRKIADDYAVGAAPRSGRPKIPASCQEVVLYIAREGARLVLENIGQPLMMHAPRIHGLLDVHPMIDDVQDGLIYDRDDAPSARRADDHEEAALRILQDARRHRGEHPFAGLDGIGLRAY